MAKAKQPSAALSMLKQMSTDRQKESKTKTAAEKDTEKTTEVKAAVKTTASEKAGAKDAAADRQPAAEKAGSEKRAEQAASNTDKPRNETASPADREEGTIDRAAYEALIAENARIQAEKEAAEQRAKEKDAEARQAAQRAATASNAGTYQPNPVYAGGNGTYLQAGTGYGMENYAYGENGPAVVKPGKTQFRNMVKEKKNVRKNFLLTPSNSEHLKEEAEDLGTSMNDLLNLILEDRYN